MHEIMLVTVQFSFQAPYFVADFEQNITLDRSLMTCLSRFQLFLM